MMKPLRSAARNIIPAKIRIRLRAVQRQWMFRQAMVRFLKDPEACAHPGNAVLTDLIYGWGNQSWGALDEFLVACIRHALITSGPILECGSGLSTVLVGAVANARGLQHWVLEHKPEWAERVQQCLNDYNLKCVTMCSNSLKDYGDFCWYGPPLASMPAGFALVICDGPPLITTKGGRYGLVPVMQNRLRPDCIILLDDAARDHEHTLASQWGNELGMSLELCGSTKPYFEMKRIDDARRS
jgi:hypothetical protein